MELINKVLFRPPRPSYDKTSFPGQLLWIPRLYFGDTPQTIDHMAVPKKEELLQGHITAMFKESQSSSSYLIYCHGNACDVGEMNWELERFQQVLKVNVLAMEYEGYGLSLGSPSPNACNRDLRIVYDYLTLVLKVPQNNIIIFGCSIGTGFAINLASNLYLEGKSVGALILQSAYSSVRDIAKDYMGLLGSLIPDTLSSKSLIKNVKCPALFIHGKVDDLIPYTHSEELLRLCGSDKKELCLLDNVDHEILDTDNHILAPVKQFLSVHFTEYWCDIFGSFPKSFFICPKELALNLADKSNSSKTLRSLVESSIHATQSYLTWAKDKLYF